ncbi:MAG: type III secretion system translocon subunit SctE [Deltaproteobacteria bacterium]|nr:type III secretion system translocon subunit SctE [Deltaproteobacteria bacterium]
MSTPVQNNGTVNSAFPLTLEALDAAKGKGIASDVTIPGATETIRNLLAQLNDQLPALESPDPKLSQDAMKNLQALTLGGLSLETLMDAIGSEERKTETKAGTATLKANAQARKAANDEKIKKLQEELEKAKEGKTLDTLLKVFKWIGIAVAAIGAVAMIAASGGAAAPIILGLASLFLVADSVTQEATDGKVGFGPGFLAGKIAEACGADEETVQWVKFGVDLAASLALMAGGIGAMRAAGSGAQIAANAVGKAQQAARVTAQAASYAGAGVTIAQSATGIANAFNEKDIATLQADQKRMNAILERLAQANDLTVEHLKRTLERIEKLTEQVAEIVDGSVETNVALMTGQSPAMA